MFITLPLGILLSECNTLRTLFTSSRRLARAFLRMAAPPGPSVAELCSMQEIRLAQASSSSLAQASSLDERQEFVSMVGVQQMVRATCLQVSWDR